MSDPLTQARDRIAELCGFVHTDNCGCDLSIVGRHQAWTIHGCDTKHWHDHPIPACLNFVSKVWPDGVELFIHRTGGKNYWAACYGAAQYRRFVVVHELADRMVLLADVLAWLRDNDPPAFDAAVEKIRKEIQG